LLARHESFAELEVAENPDESLLHHIIGEQFNDMAGTQLLHIPYKGSGPARRMRIGPQVDPGVPWCHAQSPAAGADGLLLALKSGNFASIDFFSKAFGMLA
jgi:hypothetical protein